MQLEIAQSRSKAYSEQSKKLHRSITPACFVYVQWWYQQNTFRLIKIRSFYIYIYITNFNIVCWYCYCICRSLSPCGQTRGSAVAGLQGLRVRIPPVGWISVSCECCVLSEISATGWSLVQRNPTECSVWVWSWSLYSEQALAHWEVLRHEKLFLHIFQTASCQISFSSQLIRRKRISLFFRGFCMYILSLLP